jgi:hypothetical protein
MSRDQLGERGRVALADKPIEQDGVIAGRMPGQGSLRPAQDGSKVHVRHAMSSFD